MAAGSIVGTFIGGQLLGLIPNSVLLPMLADILLYLTLNVWRRPQSSSARLPFLQLFTTTISGLSLAALLCTTNALALALVLSLRARWTRSAAMIPASPAFSRVT